MKRLLSVVLSAVLILSVCAGINIQSFASDSFVTDDGFGCTILDDNTIEITSYSGTDDPVNIPTVIFGKSVSSIGMAAFINNTEISEVRVPESVTSIGVAAFYGCAFITDIDLPDGLETIGNDAFGNCSKLKSIKFGKAIKSIDTGVLEGCNELTAIEVSEENENYSSLCGVLYNKDKTQLIRYPSGNKSNVFTVMSRVEAINSTAFDNCSALTDIYLPSVIKTVEENAFKGANNIKNVYFQGTETEWENVSVAPTGNAAFIGAQYHFETMPAPCDKHVIDEESIVITEPTCKEKGSEKGNCIICQTVVSKEIPALPHTVVTDKAVAATYFSKGKTKGSHCSVCKTVIVKQTATPKLTLAVPKKIKVTQAKKGFNVKYAKNSKATGYQIQYSTSKKFTKKTTKTKTYKSNKSLSYKFRNKKLKKRKTYYVRVRAYVKSADKKKTAYSKWSSVKTVKTK